MPAVKIQKFIVQEALEQCAHECFCQTAELAQCVLG